MSPWHGYTHDTTHISGHTLVFHPTLLEFMRAHGFGSRTIAEGLMFGDRGCYTAKGLSMFGGTSNMRYIGLSFKCPEGVKEEFEVGRT